MARSRNIKPGFFENEVLAELPFESRLLFAGLWTLADREGRLEDRPKRIVAKLFPYDTGLDGESLLDGLAQRGFISRYRVKEQQYIQVEEFAAHQNPHPRESPSTIPPKDEGDPVLKEEGSPKADLGAPEVILSESSTMPSNAGSSYVLTTGPSEPSGSALASAQAREDGADAPRKAKRASPIDPEFDYTTEMMDWACESPEGPGICMADVKRETEKFVDHFLANGKTMKDWGAAWKNWMRRSREFSAARASPRNGSAGKSYVELAKEADERESRRNQSGAGDHPRSLLASAEEPGVRPGLAAGDVVSGDGGPIDAGYRVRADGVAEA